MAAKTGGNRRAPAAAVKVAAGAAVSPADAQETLIPEPAAVVETPVLVEDATNTVEVLAPGAEEVAADAASDEAATEPALNRLAAIAALTGAVPAPDAPTSVPVVEAAPNGRESVWADGEKELVAAVVVVTSIQGVVDGNRLSAYKGETLHATEAVIARGVALGALVRV